MTALTKGTLLLMLAMMAALPAEAFEPTMDIFVENPLQPIFHGSTNLPDGSELMLTLARSQSGYMAQSQMKVAGGHFTTEQFSADGAPLNPGHYKVEISMSMAALQPASVQAVIGSEGQKMTGKLVARSVLGGFVFDYVTEKQIGGPANASMDAAARAQANIDLRNWEIKECTSNIDFVNALARAGKLTGSEIVGEERQRKIDACTADANRPPQ
jgi:hypothetical protein